MNSIRKVVYHTKLEALDGFDPEVPNQNETAEGLFVGLSSRIQCVDGKPFQITEALIEDPQTHEIKRIDYRLLKEFV